MTHESIYDITFSCNEVVRHEEITAHSFPEALEELEKLIPADYIDVLGCTETEVPNLLQGQDL